MSTQTEPVGAPAPVHTRDEQTVQMVSEGLVDGVELVTLLDASGAVLEQHVPLNQHAKVCGC